MHLRHFARAAGFLGIPLGIAVLAAQQPQVLTPAGAEVQLQLADLLFADGRYRESREAYRARDNRSGCRPRGTGRPRAWCCRGCALASFARRFWTRKRS